MVLIYWWLACVLVVGAATLFIATRFANNKKRKAVISRIPVAHGNRLSVLPAYNAALRRYRLFVQLTAACLALLLVISTVLAARPSTITVEQPDIRNRDIMLCLDISGSMTATNANLLATFSELANDFKGERLGLTLFDSSSSNIFPLTDDYAYVKEKLKEVSDAFLSDDYSTDIYSGTYNGQGSSLIGDGLASCVLRFDNLDIERSRSVILATDNYVNGKQIINLVQAGGLAKKKSVRVYGINPADYSSGSYVEDEAREFHDVSLSTNGGYYKINYTEKKDKTIVEGIVKQISSQEATRFKGAPRIVQSDVPFWFVISGLVTVTGFCIIAWRLRK